ncbi:MAG TPA: C45 family peptidase [Thermoanaerobaculaceae bacterium]|nr:C45 family peptidase [Thermoanaerobaculaceae bacterium]
MKPRTIARMLFLALLTPSLLSCGPKADPRLSGSWRGEKVNGWIPVRLQGPPAQIGFQHGYLLAPEIRDAIKVIQLSLPHETKRDWAFLRTAAETILWPHVEEEYREELRGILEGLTARGVRADLTDVVVLNAFLEMSYYTDTLDEGQTSSAPERCSAFVATGSWTRDGKVVIAHNNWSGYLEGARWNIIFDIQPEKGDRILMDGFPGLIHSGDDFGMNSAGIVITETTISRFHGFDPNGVPEFVRARKAMQYAASIDDFARIMRDGNNGGYANAWLVADTKRNEIGRLELGLKYVTLERTTDGYYVGANFPIDPRLTAEETDFPASDPGVSGCARRTCWEQLIPKFKGRIDVEAAKRFLADHYDAYEKKADAPSERTLCGHVDLSPRGMKPWQDAFGPAGTVQAKIADAAMAQRMELEAAMGHPCGRGFVASEHLKRYPQFEWQRELLRDLPSRPWTRFSARQPI